MKDNSRRMTELKRLASDLIEEMSPCIAVHLGADGDIVYVSLGGDKAVGFGHAPMPGIVVALRDLPLSELAILLDYGEQIPKEQVRAQVVDWGFEHQIRQDSFPP